MPASPLRALAGRLRRSPDALAVLLFVLVPLAQYLPGAFTGSPVIPGDDLFQNEPLRALAGQLIATGRLPAWDPLIWSGTPLLAGWNAGAMFPGTWLFAFMPGAWAWVLNYAAVPILAGIGAYAFFRRERLRPLGAFLAAAVFAYSGFVSGQSVHVGLDQGTALSAWMLLGVQLACSSTTRPSRLGGVALSGAAIGLLTLAGDPRAVSSAIVLLAIYTFAKLWRLRGRWRSVLLDVIGAGVLGALIGAAQWLPGLAFLRSSQRSGSTYVFYSSGSLGFPQILRGLLVPFLTGGNGNLGMPIYQGDYNLPELTIGVGLTALIAGLVYLPALLEDLRAWTRSRPVDADRRPLGTIYVLIVVGGLLTLGSFTPLGHLFMRIPLFGGERLQNRNAVLFDFALAWICGYFVDDAMAPVASGARRPLAARQALALLPPVFAAALFLIALVDPAGTEALLRYSPAVPAVVAQMWPYIAYSLAVAAAAIALVLLAPRLTRRARARAVAVLVVADLVTFLASASYATVPPSTLASANPLSTALGAVTGRSGRFAIFNPLYATGGSANLIADLGVTDLNLLHGIGSAQGYGSIVNGVYQTFTGTHTFESLSSGVLAGETFNTLDLSALLTLPTYLAEPIAPSARVPLAMPPDAGHPERWTTSGTNVAPPAPDAGGPWAIDGVRSAWFVLGAPRTLRSVTVDLDRFGRPLPPTLRIVAETDGRIVDRAEVPLRHGHVSLALPRNQPIAAIEVQDPHRSAATIGAVIVNAAHPEERLLLDGALQGALQPGHWDYQTSIASLLVFHNSHTIGLAWLQPARSKTPNTAKASGAVDVVMNSPVTPQVLRVDVARASQLVRAEGYAPGWRATIQPQDGGSAWTVSVHRFGLVQAIGLNPGRYRITFHYAPPTLVIGFALSALGTLGLLVLLALALALATRRRRGPRGERSTDTAVEGFASVSATR